MVATAWSLGRRRSLKNLRLCDRFDIDLLVKRVNRSCVKVARQIVDALLQILIPFVEEILLSAALSIVA